MIAFYEEEDADYLSYGTSQGIPAILTHFGFWAEIVKTETLKKVSKCTQEPLFIEHVTNFIHTQPERFKIKLLPIATQIEKHKNLRLILIGYGEYKGKIIRYIKKNNLEKKVTVIDSCSNPYPYIEKSNLFIFNRKKYIIAQLRHLA